MSLIGATGSLAFDNDHALADAPRRNTSVVVGTAASHPAHFGNYAVGRDFVSEPDGSLVRFGDALTIAGRYPHYRLTGRFGDVEADLRLTTSDTVTWFVRNPVYKHLNLLTEYRGRFSTASGVQEVSGLCAFEYGACPSPYQLRSAPLPAALKAPLDLFVYQIINLRARRPSAVEPSLHRRQTIHLHRPAPVPKRPGARAGAREGAQPRPGRVPCPGVPAGTGGHPVRNPDAGTGRHPVHRSRRTRNRPGGDRRVGHRPHPYGLGTGFVTGFRHESTWRGETISGRGYMEYIDRRDG